MKDKWLKGLILFLSSSILWISAITGLIISFYIGFLLLTGSAILFCGGIVFKNERNRIVIYGIAMMLIVGNSFFLVGEYLWKKKDAFEQRRAEVVRHDHALFILKR